MEIDILGKTYKEVLALALDQAGTEEHALEVLKSIYKRGIFSFDEIFQIPIKAREKFKKEFKIVTSTPVCKTNASDGTIKYLVENGDGQQFETVFMPSSKRNTLCISTQSGCRMGCKFCLTGKIEFKGSLSAGDILNQYLSIPERKVVNRIVIMGMGEPFDNFEEVKKAVTILTANWGAAFGASNITISSVGLHEPLAEFLKNPFCNLAISLNNPFSKERQSLMPIEASNPIIKTVELIKASPLPKPLRISFEYVALSSENISVRHALAIASLLNGVNCHLNIIRWNSHKNSAFKSPSETELKAFIDCLNINGVRTTIRNSRGQDIGAACGQMVGTKLAKV